MEILTASVACSSAIDDGVAAPDVLNTTSQSLSPNEVPWWGVKGSRTLRRRPTRRWVGLGVASPDLKLASHYRTSKPRRAAQAVDGSGPPGRASESLLLHFPQFPKRVSEVSDRL